MTLLAGVLLVPVTVAAQFDPFGQACDTPPNQNTGTAQSAACQANGADNPLTGSRGVISRVTSILSVVLGVISVIFIIWAGMKYITANGDSSSISSAKSTVIYALVGLVVALLARPLINMVLSRIA
jgi:hypothetical protein